MYNMVKCMERVLLHSIMYGALLSLTQNLLFLVICTKLLAGLQTRF
uniref:Uncharacterized protein n=1 Tax=Rhizophora mucronata TaxID=61149 RepID=A0A2P2P6Q2_RHIMU